jgi:hypothetical protein
VAVVVHRAQVRVPLTARKSRDSGNSIIEGNRTLGSSSDLTTHARLINTIGEKIAYNDDHEGFHGLFIP